MSKSISAAASKQSAVGTGNGEQNTTTATAGQIIGQVAGSNSTLLTSDDDGHSRTTLGQPGQLPNGDATAAAPQNGHQHATPSKNKPTNPTGTLKSIVSPTPRKTSASSTASNASAVSSASHYLSSLVSKSTNLLQSLKQQYTTLNPAAASMESPKRGVAANSGQSSSASRESSHERENLAANNNCDSSTSNKSGSTAAPASKSQAIITQPTTSQQTPDNTSQPTSPLKQISSAVPQSRPPLPPPPPKEVVLATLSKQQAKDGGQPDRRHALQEQSLERDAAIGLKVRAAHRQERTSSIKTALRHAHLGPLRRSGRNRSGEKLSGKLSADSSQSYIVKSQPYELYEPPVTQRTFQRTKRQGAMMASDPRRQMSADTMGLRQLTDEYLRNAGVDPMSNHGQCSLATLNGGKNGPGSSAAGSNKKTASGTACSIVANPNYNPMTGCLESFPIEAQLFQASKHLGGESSANADGADGGGSGGRVSHWHHYRAETTASLLTACVSGSDNADGEGETQRRQVKSLNDSEDSLTVTGFVTILPGNLPWQTDVAIQCEILKPSEALDGSDCQTGTTATSNNEPFETTGDLLKTIAGPYRIQLNSCSNHYYYGSSLDANNTASNPLSATLKRGLTAISQHHLSPAGAPGAAAALHVVGNLKKSLSNTFDMSLANARTAAAHQLHSQDSLPSYASLQNETDESTPGHTLGCDHQQIAGTSSACNQSSDTSNQTFDNLAAPDASHGGFIGQIASKLGRQSSRKFAADKKGLQRALSFDCRGYKRLEQSTRAGHQRQQSQRKQQSNDSTSSSTGSQAAFALSPGGGATGNLKAPCKETGIGTTTGKQQHNNKSTLGPLYDQTGPRPYLPQSASQVDFQVPLLPYHIMHEAIVSQRLLEPTPASPPSSVSRTGQLDTLTSGCVQTGSARQPDVDELLCGDLGLDTREEETMSVAPATSGSNSSYSLGELRRGGATDKQGLSNRTANRPSTDSLGLGECGRAPDRSFREMTSPQLVLNIPTIATSNVEEQSHDSKFEPSASSQHGNKQRNADSYMPDYEDGEEINNDDEGSSSKATVIVCPPSPNVALDTTFQSLPNSNSFCIDTGRGQKNGLLGAGASNQLTANDVFKRSTNFIKRPSTMMADDDAMNQVAQALEKTGNRTAKQQQQQQRQVSSVRKSRRQAIVPPKLATDASSDGDSDNKPEAPIGTLIEIGDESANTRTSRTSDGAVAQSMNFDTGDYDDFDEAHLRHLRRKRSGGGGHSEQRASERQRTAAAAQFNNAPAAAPDNNQQALPTFYIEPEAGDNATSEGVSSFTRPNSGCAQQARPDSQMTNVESIVSSGSSANLSFGGLPPTPGGLSVAFGASSARRRSSIAVIPQMQICPGDLLVYSKQLIDRMNQPEEAENQPPQFLTIDDKKGKNIWSSFKLFDNRTLKARTELLCSLEDVLASIQPSTFVDEQLSHYKGMLWNEFIYETESHRSASSVGLNQGTSDKEDSGAEHAGGSNRRLQSTGEDDKNGYNIRVTVDQASEASKSPSPMKKGAVNKEAGAESTGGMRRSGSVRDSIKRIHDTVKASVSSSGMNECPAASQQESLSNNNLPKSPSRHISSRFREKPKLKRGQTVDSVFRIPLIPSSPLKHAQLHQQTPTAHLEDLNTIEDDERSSPSATSCTSTRDQSPSESHRKCPSSTRSRSASNQLLSSKKIPDENENGNKDSSFETDDAADLQSSAQSGKQAAGRTTTPNQIVRQSSLSTISSTITRTEQKRQRALWDLFQSECAFFFDHLMTLKNVYMEPLKKIQVEGFAMFADPDVLFGNLDELCCGVYDFCKEFLYIIMRTLKTRPEELNATDVLLKLYKKNPKIDHLRGVYHRYTLNYINALTYLDSLRKQVEFVEFERWSSRDVRCKKLQLTDLLVAPVQHIMRVPIILKDIESHTEDPRDREEIRAILAVEEASLRELDDKMRWLKNFERLLEIQKNISWPNVLEMDPKLFIPDFLKDVLLKQPCEKLIVSPRRQIVHEGTLSSYDQAKASDMHVILFDDMLLLTRRKRMITKKASTVCKTYSGGPSTRDDGTFKYIVYKQPLCLDRFVVHDVQSVDSQTIGIKHLFMLIVMNRFQQITNVHSFGAPNEDVKQTWLFKIKKTTDRWKRNFSSTTSGEQQQQQQQQQAQLIHQISTTKRPATSQHGRIAPANSPAALTSPIRPQRAEWASDQQVSANRPTEPVATRSQMMSNESPN